MYPENENPVFAPWTGNRGGGPPCLWEFEGHLYTHRWLQPNVDFLKQNLGVSKVSNLIARATDVLRHEPEHAIAEEVLADLPLCKSTLESRCADSHVCSKQLRNPAIYLNGQDEEGDSLDRHKTR